MDWSVHSTAGTCTRTSRCIRQHHDSLPLRMSKSILYRLCSCASLCWIPPLQTVLMTPLQVDQVLQAGHVDEVNGRSAGCG